MSGSSCSRGSSSRLAGRTRCGSWKRRAPGRKSRRGRSCPRPALSTSAGTSVLVLYDVSTLCCGPARATCSASPASPRSAGTADHHRPAHRAGRIPADGLRVRRQQRPRPRPCCLIGKFMAAHPLSDVTAAVGCGLAEPGGGHDAVVDLQSRRVIGGRITTDGPSLTRRSSKPALNQVPTCPDFARPRETSPDIRAALTCGNRIQYDTVRRIRYAWPAEGQGFESP